MCILICLLLISQTQLVAVKSSSTVISEVSTSFATATGDTVCMGRQKLLTDCNLDKTVPLPHSQRGPVTRSLH